MMSLRDADAGQLVDLLRRYGGLDVRFQNEILFLAAKSGRDSSTASRSLAHLLQHRADRDAPHLLLREVGIVEAHRRPGGSARNLDAIVDLVRHWFDRRHEVPAWKVALACQLHLDGLCPLVTSAFGRDQLCGPVDQAAVRRLIEVSITYLYRIPVCTTPATGDLDPVSRDGAVCDVYRSPDGRAVKIPKTLAATAFLARQEMANAVDLSATPLAPFMAGGYAFDERASIVSHHYVPGPTGEQVLWGAGLTAEHRASLRRFHGAYRPLAEVGWFLDVHPGNFVWDTVDGEWKLIDLGSVPAMGFELYDHPAFDDYLRLVWLRRRDDMARFPVRSFDLTLDLVARRTRPSSPKDGGEYAHDDVCTLS